MRKLFVAVALLGLVAVTGGADNPKPAQDKKESPKKRKASASLKVGDLAPALKAGKWLQGKEVKGFEPGQVYVVEFWATWCGWCIAFMPDAAELQAQYKDQGVTIIGFSARDPQNTGEQVAAFVKKRGPKLPYTFAYAADRTTYDAWMKSAGREGIPCAFVVDKAGRIAYIGHPMYLGVVLPKVVAGNANAQAVGDEMDKIEQEFRAVSGALFPDHKAGLKALKAFETKYPPMANNSVIIRAKLSLLPKLGEVDEAKQVAEAVMARAIKQNNPGALLQVSALLRNGSGKESKELLAVAVKAAQAAVQVAGDQDAGALIDLAQTYRAIGDKAKAREYGRKAGQVAGDQDASVLLSVAETYFAIGDKVEAARYAQKAVAAAAGESVELKQHIEQQAKRFDDENKKDKK
jgi:thiol-disulfide isomerase/thioredoxin